MRRPLFFVAAVAFLFLLSGCFAPIGKVEFLNNSSHTVSVDCYIKFLSRHDDFTLDPGDSRKVTFNVVIISFYNNSGQDDLSWKYQPTDTVGFTETIDYITFTDK